MKYCSKCGNEVRDNDLFCSKCGANLDFNSQSTPIENCDNKTTNENINQNNNQNTSQNNNQNNEYHNNGYNQYGNYYQNNHPYNNSNQYHYENDKPSTALAVVSFFFPIVGLVLYLAMLDSKPISSKKYGKMALIGFLVGVVLGIIIFVASLIIAGVAVSSYAVITNAMLL